MLSSRQAKRMPKQGGADALSNPGGIDVHGDDDTRSCLAKSNDAIVRLRDE